MGHTYENSGEAIRNALRSYEKARAAIKMVGTDNPCDKGLSNRLVSSAQKWLCEVLDEIVGEACADAAKIV